MRSELHVQFKNDTRRDKGTGSASEYISVPHVRIIATILHIHSFSHSFFPYAITLATENILG
jgi:hypothetical protein